ncbi:MAG TPA: hypothetical protein VD963_01160, partial [Phycisphaerales bacterium]|nr:hypothetical protein [Phycisphaerales bacterium]
MSRRRAAEAVWIGALGLGALGVGVAAGLDPIPTTMNDFFLPGSQPGAMEEPFQSSRDACALCHSSGDDSATLPYNRWRASMMGQASRDPIFAACLAVANQDAAFAGDLCLRCHTPQGWIDGHSTPTDGSALVGTDFEGVSCSICHRMVDPVYVSGQSPVEDQGILAALSAIPATPHSGTYIIDPFDRRRGPLNLDQDWPNGFFWHEWRQSPFHLSSALCATCHDVSNPVYTRQADGTYALNALDQAHETQNKYDQFPVERTYSEWSRSLFAQGPVDLDGRFGGARAFVSSCQDCHMPTAAGTACGTFLSPPYRPDVPKHEFAGANTWVLRAVRELYPDAETGLSAQAVDESVARATDMLQRASDMELTRQGGSLNVRVINFSGHKLPTGYAEGRRMWLNVRFYDAANALMAERGGYDPATGYCDYHNTKVYEAIFGVDAAVAALTGIPVGESFHFVVNNVLLFDNRIPPMGFSNTGFAAVQAAPVGYAYADGQYWDDTA